MLTELVESIRQFLEADISPLAPDSFAVIYGSSAYRHGTRSDLDVAFILDKDISGIQERAESFIRDLHAKYSLEIDQEVPFSNKLVYAPDRVKSALSLNYFINPVTNKCSISPIRKDEDFLASAEVNGRLLINALTTPHIIVGETDTVYHLRELAGRQVGLLSIALLSQNNETISPENSFAVLETGLSGERGEMYLGYKTEYEAVQVGLMKLVHDVYAKLAYNGVLSREGDKWTLLTDPTIAIRGV